MSKQISRDPPPADLGRDDTAPLVEALHDERADVRVAVLDALLALPLGPDVWLEVGDYVRWVLQPGGDAPERDEIGARAARVPLRSIRKTLAAIANGDDPASGAAARSLASVGDGSALDPLLAELRAQGAGHTDAGRYLAMLDVSSAASQVEEAFAAATAAADDDAMWLALALARAGRDAPLRAFVATLETGAAPLPTLFWGDPAVARAALSSGPALPTSVATWLESVRDGRSGDAETFARILLEAGEPTIQAGLVADVDPVRVPGREATEAAAPAVASLLDPDGRLRDGWNDRVAALPPPDRTAVVSALVVALLEHAEDVFAGNVAVEAAHAYADDFVPDVSALAALAVGGSPVAEQAAWAASRGGARLLVASLAAGIADPGLRAEAVRFLARAARHLRRPGPLVLGGAPADTPAPAPELIEDMLMAGPPPAQPVGAEGPGEPAPPPQPAMPIPVPPPARTRGRATAPAPPHAMPPVAPTPVRTRGRATEPTSPPATPLPPAPAADPPPTAARSRRARVSVPRLSRARRPRAQPASQERVLQAEVSDTSDAAAPVPLRRGFRRGAWHRLVVTIGPEQATALPGVGPTFDEVLGPQEQDLLLDFVFNAIGAVPPDQALQLKDKVRLPVGGSAEVSFDFQLLSTLDEVRIELEVRMGQRTIQPATLVGPAADDPSTLPEASAIRLLRGRPLAHLSSAAARPPLDGVVSVGGGPATPAPVATVAQSDRISFFDTTRLKDATRGLELLLDTIVTDDRTVTQSLEDDAAQQGLFKLALRGAQLYEAVGAQIAEALGSDASRVQLLLRNDSVVMPLELAYDLGAPARGATLCPNWKKALASGTCDPTFHPTADDGNAAVVCPSGFWAISKIIERQLAPESLFSEAASSFDVAAHAELTPASDSLPLLDGAVLAASDRVPRPEFKALRETLEHTVGRSACATSWSGWRRGIKRTQASLLVLLSHTVKDDTGWALQIGKADNLYVAQVNAQYVSTAEPPRLIALLLGCETVENPEELQSFVARFRSNGASLVIGTVCGVLGERAPRVAEEIVRQLAAAAGSSSANTAGVVMQDVRRTLLARGELTALALAAYGDVDWRITRG